MGDGERDARRRELLTPEAATRLFRATTSGAPSDTPPAPAAPDGQVIGDYVVVRALGEGGSGSAYLAHRKGGERLVTLKLMRHPLGSSSQSGRAWRELEMLRTISCPVVPRLHEFGEHDGRFFLVYDYIEGTSVLDHAGRHCPDLRSRVVLLAAIARALHAVHDRGVIHRDVKPGNILVGEDRTSIYMIDLGCAAIACESGSVSTSMTAEGVPIGTPAYMAPEQARGERDSIMIRSDVYSLGAVGYQLLTGNTPHDVDVPLHEAIRRVAQDPPRDPRKLRPDLPTDLAAILQAATAPRPEDRMQTALEFSREIDAWLANRPVSVARPSIVRRIHLAARRRPYVAGSLVAAVIAAATLYWLALAAHTNRKTSEALRVAIFKGLTVFDQKITEKDFNGALQQLGILEALADGDPTGQVDDNVVAQLDADLAARLDGRLDGPALRLEVAERRRRLAHEFLTALRVAAGDNVEVAEGLAPFFDDPTAPDERTPDDND